MTTSDGSWSPRFRLISELERPDHWHLTDQDQCYFMGEYTARAGFSHSTTNSIVSNLKKPVTARGTAHWKYKGQALQRCAAAMRAGIHKNSLEADWFVPIPPSKTPDHPEYDDRIIQLATAIAPDRVANLLVTKTSRQPRHAGDNKRCMEELRETIGLAHEAPFEQPPRIFLVDDVLTTGCSFKVCKEMLAPHFPNVPILGIFVARRAIPQGDFPDFVVE